MSTLTLLPLDLTASRLSNRIVGESHTLITIPLRPNRLLVPQFGGFYAEYMQVFNAANQLLIKGTDYVTTYLYNDLTDLTGRAVYALIVIINPAVSPVVTINYRAVGGSFGLSTAELAVVLDQLADENQVLDWSHVVGKPREYPSLPHTHKFWQLYGLDTIVADTENLADAIVTGASAAYAHDSDYAETYLGLAEDRAGELAAEIDAHIARVDNPHQDTKAQVGLGNVQNYPFGVQAEAEAGTVDTKYMSAQLTYNAVAAQASAPLATHAANHANPHQVTAAQLGVYNKSELDGIVATKLRKDAVASNSNTLQSRDVNQLYAETRVNLNAANVVGTLPVARLGAGGTNGSYVLRGDGQWVVASTLFQSYAPPVVKTVFAGFFTTRANGMAFINANYSNISQYPSGSIALYTERMSVWVSEDSHDNNVQYFFYRVSGAYRTAGGWVTMGGQDTSVYIPSVKWDPLSRDN